MKIVVVGTRGIPDIQGGVETHCEELYPRLAAMGHDVTVVRRSCYVTPQNKIKEYKGVHLKDIYAPRRKSIEAIVHTFLAIIYARWVGADVLHIHAIGPALLTPLARLLGLRVVMTHHGPDYDRQKWNKTAKSVLRWGERMGTNYANEVIVISTVIDNILREKYDRTDAHLIYNGVNKPVPAKDDSYIRSLGLTPRRYVLAVGRFVEEKGFDLLIKAFARISGSNCKLVIAGDADHEDHYSVSLKRLAEEHHVVLLQQELFIFILIVDQVEPYAATDQEKQIVVAEPFAARFAAAFDLVTDRDDAGEQIKHLVHVHLVDMRISHEKRAPFRPSCGCGMLPV